MFPEQHWGVFYNDVFVRSFPTYEQAQRYADNKNEEAQ
jgi:hypothetical protein